VTLAVWTIIETKAEAKLGLNPSAGRIVLGLGCAAIFFFDSSAS
jgi:hypothetical protein